MSYAQRLALRGRFSPSITPPPPPYLLTGPYGSAFSGTTVKTQVHCHTTSSDGSYAPASVVAGYLAAGYGALVITDHDVVTSQPAGITTAITGNELSPTTQHIISMNSSYTRAGATDAQTILDGIAAAGGLAEIAHPKWYRGMTYAEMAALTNYLGTEIHNGHCMAGSGSNPVTYPAFAVDRWDDLLRGSRRDVWAFAVDDLHSVNAYSAYDMGRLQVFASENTLSGVMTALEDGEFVADVGNFGVTPGYPVRDGDGISLSCTGATKIEAWGADGLLTSSTGTSHTHSWDGTESYVRLVAVGDYTEGFGSALSDRWYAVDGTWTVSGGVMALTNTASLRRIILRRHVEGDFAAQVDVNLSSVSTDDSAALMFHVLNGSYYYMVRIGGSTVSGYDDALTIARTTNNSFAAGSQLAGTPFTATPGTWYTIKMDFTAGTRTIRAKVWERGTAEPDWMVSVVDGAWTYGAFGLRAIRAPQFDNFYVDGFRTYYQPVAID